MMLISYWYDNNIRLLLVIAIVTDLYSALFGAICGLWSRMDVIVLRDYWDIQKVSEVCKWDVVDLILLVLLACLVICEYILIGTWKFVMILNECRI